MQALIYMTAPCRRRAASCSAIPSPAPIRAAAALDERAALAEREGMRKAHPVTLDKSWPADVGDRAA